MASAAHLAADGRRVVLFERSELAAGASGRNSGVVQHPFDPILVDLYRETVELYRALGERSGDGFRLPESPVGLLSVTFDAAGAERLSTSLAMTHPGLRPTFVPPGAMRDLEPGLASGVAACRLDIGFPVAPAAATRAYAAWSVRLGVEVRLATSARLWLGAGRVHGIALDDGSRVAAEHVVVAAGPWTPEVVDRAGTWRPIRPSWGVVVPAALAAPPRHVLEEADISIEPGQLDPGHAFSLVTAGRQSTLGSTFLESEPDAAAFVGSIVERGARFVPAIAHAPLGPVRACARPLSLDGRPLIGAVPGVAGLWVAAGHGPWGISTGPASGRLIADLIGRSIAAPPAGLDPGRFDAPSI